MIRSANHFDFEDLDVGSRYGVRRRAQHHRPCSRFGVLLGLPDVHVEAVERDGTKMSVTVSTPWQLMGCPECGVVAPSRGRRRRVLHDVTHGDARVRLVWRQRTWRCPGDSPRR